MIKTKLADSIKEVDYELPYLGKGSILFYKDEHDCYRISCEEINYMVSECIMGETERFDFDSAVGKCYSGFLVSFCIKEYNEKVFYFAIIESKSFYPIFIYRREGQAISNPNIDICYLPDKIDVHNFDINLISKGADGSISALAYFTCINKLKNIRNPINRGCSIPKLEKLLKKTASLKFKKDIYNEMLFVKKSMNDAQIHYSGLIDFYEKKLQCT